MTVVAPHNPKNTLVTEPVELATLNHGDLFLTDTEPATDGTDERFMFLSFAPHGHAMVATNRNENNFVRGFESGLGRNTIVHKVIGHSKG